MKKDSLAVLVLIALALLLLLMESKAYFPIGYFPNRWIYVLSIGGLVYKARKLIRAFFKFEIIRWSCLLLFIASLYSGVFIIFFYIPALLFQFLGIEREVLFENEKYCMMITSDVFRSGGQSNYTVFEKKPIGVKRIFESWGPVKHRNPTIISLNGELFLVLENRSGAGSFEKIRLR